MNMQRIATVDLITDRLNSIVISQESDNSDVDIEGFSLSTIETETVCDEDDVTNIKVVELPASIHALGTMSII